MKYLQNTPMVFGSTKDYSAAWERTFGKQDTVQSEEAQRNNRRRVVLSTIKKGRK